MEWAKDNKDFSQIFVPKKTEEIKNLDKFLIKSEFSYLFEINNNHIFSPIC